MRLEDLKQFRGIKAIAMKKGYRYMLFFPLSSGIKPEDLTYLQEPLLTNVSFIVESTDGIKFIELKDHVVPKLQSK